MTSPNLQKRHFELIAEIVAITVRNAADRATAIEKVCILLGETNQRFNETTFKAAVEAASHG